MALTPGTRLGVYEVIDVLGAGGMGEVYRARDSKLGRAVAVKLLLDSVAGDPDRVARFEREAKSLAALNHPHIAALYGLEQSNGRHFLVMELVDGETLAERIARGPLPLEQALTVALQIADALEAAHEKGIVHRDLKPANVKITSDEKVKVLDFGLAKAMDTEPAMADLAHSPTLSMRMTGAGVILGTAAYMSPEQAKGLPADQRSDVFSFGVVLFEMLTGRQPFQGETAPEILASVLIREPELGGLPPNLNPRLLELLKRCLDKHPKRRWQAIGDLRAELETIAVNPRHAPAVAHGGAPRPIWKSAAALVVTAVLAAGVTAAAFVWSIRRSPAPAPVSRFLLTLPQNQQFVFSRSILALSPDGTQVVYASNNRLFLRAMADLEPRAIPGSDTVDALSNPVFSPDGRAVVYASLIDRTLRKISLTGGTPVTLCSLDTVPVGVSWSGNDLVFQSLKGISRMPASGGTPQVIITAGANEMMARPQMLPGGDFVLFTLSGASRDWDHAQIVAQSLKTSERRVLVSGGTDAHYLPSGHLVYANGGVLFAVPFDVQRIAVSGEAVPVVEGVRRGVGTVGAAAAEFAFSSTGSLVFFPGPVTTTNTQRDFVLANRSGTATPINLPPGPYNTPRFSPDGKHLAFGSDDGKDASIWIYDLAGTTAMRRLTFGGRDRFPVWTVKGDRVIFQSEREGDAGIFWQRADGNGPVERLTKAEGGVRHVPESWSPTGDRLLFSAAKGQTFSLSVLSLPDKKTVPFPAVQSERPIGAVFSPDGRWVAYATSNPTGGQDTVYVEPFPPTSAKYQVSRNDDGHHPVWSSDGKELTFIPSPGRLAGVSVTTQPSFSVGPPVDIPRAFTLFNAPSDVRSHDLSADGRFVGLINGSGATAGRAAGAVELEVVLNWFEDLKQRVPVR